MMSVAIANVEKHYPSGNAEKVKKYYDEWARSYDSDLSELQYNFPEIVAKKVVSLTTAEEREKWSFLDLGTGTGAIGQAMRNHGFAGHFTALDYSEDMLKKAMARDKVFQKGIQHQVTKSTPIPLEDNSLDMIVCTGFAPDMIKIECLEDVLGLIRSNGYLLIYVRDTEVMTEYRKDVIKTTDDLLARGVIQSVDRHLFDLYRWTNKTTGAMESIKAKLTVFKKS